MGKIRGRAINLSPLRRETLNSRSLWRQNETTRTNSGGDHVPLLFYPKCVSGLRNSTIGNSWDYLGFGGSRINDPFDLGRKE